jgi:uncharacterized membrane protein HdeD (DUF308 family)
MVILVRNWWALALRGGVAVLFGLIALVWPDITLEALILLFGAYALVDGVFAIVSAVRHSEDRQDWWSLLVEGIVGIAIGIIAFVWPDLTALALLYLIAVWAVITGVLDIVAAVRLRQAIEGEWLLGLSGLMSVILGLLLVAFPGSGAVAIVWLIGAFAIAVGTILIALGLRLRSLQRGRVELA